MFWNPIDENLSIGTSDGFGQLIVKDTIQLYNNSVDGPSYTNQVIGEINSQVRSYGSSISTARYAAIEFCVSPSAYYQGDIRFFTNGSDGTSSVGTERMRIRENGKIGIGTGDPTGDLTISDATYLSSASTVGAKFTLNSENTSSWLGTRELIALESVGNGADHRTGTLSVKLKKGNSDTTLTEYMQINAVSNYLTFTPSGNERMRINSNTTTLTTNSAEYYATGMQINSTNADFSGALLDMRATSGSINTANGRFLRFYSNNGSSEKFHVKGSGEIYTAAGITFDDAGGSGTSSSNTLDSYEEGTWVPVVKDGSVGAVITLDQAYGFYTKIGRQVYVNGTVNRNDATGYASTLLFTGLPFTSAGGTGSLHVNGGFWVDTASATDPIAMAYIGNGTTTAYLKTINQSAAYIASNQMENGRGIYFSFTYIAA
jgi:hypothetical protein